MKNFTLKNICHNYFTLKKGIIDSFRSNVFLTFLTLFFGLSSGIQFMLTGFFATGFSAKPYAREIFTNYGNFWNRPDSDIPIFFAGILLGGTLSIWLLSRVRKSSGNSLLSQNQFSVVLVILMLWSLGFFLFTFFTSRWTLIYALTQTTLSGFWKNIIIACWSLIFMMPGVAGITVFLDFSGGHKLSRIVDRIRISGKFQKILDLLVIVTVMLIIYVPDRQYLSGVVFHNDHFVHWDGYAMRAALAHSQGQAMGNRAYIQYGVGWPLVLSFIDRFTPLTYGTAIYAVMIYGIFYYTGVYLFLRLLTVSFSWSVAGLFLILRIQFFTVDLFLWQHPQASFLRTPFDIWLFFIIGFVMPSAKWQWLIGILTGLSLLFGFDTGIYISASLIFFFLWPYTARRKSSVRVSVLPVLTAFAVVVLTGLGIAGNWQLVSPLFWKGISEGIVNYSAGISHLPVILVENDLVLFQFVVMLFTYGSTLIFILPSVIGRKLTQRKLLIATIALYGLIKLVMFVARSERHYLERHSLAFWILLVYFLCYSASKIMTRLQNSKYTLIESFLGSFRRIFSWSIVAVVIIAIGLRPNYQYYPNIFWELTHKPRQGPCLLDMKSDVCGLPETETDTMRQFQAVSSALKKIGQPQDVAIFDAWDGLFAANSDTGPFFRYRPVEILTRKQLKVTIDQIKSQPPEFIVFRNYPEPKSAVDVWSLFYENVRTPYHLYETVGRFEIWQKN